MSQRSAVSVSLPTVGKIVGTRLRTTARRRTNAKVKANANANEETKDAQPLLALRVRVMSLLAETLPTVVVLLLLLMMIKLIQGQYY
jgi:hypothetical protein